MASPRVSTVPARFLAVAVAVALATAVSLAAVVSGCARPAGWGLVLWSVEAAGIASGTVVPIQLKSNIGKVFVIGPPSGSGRFEVPFWQVEEFRSRRAASARAAEFKPWAPLYMVATRDGLPIRDKPDNGARRVFRLREGQTVKVLAKAEGSAVTTGGKTLEGEWYRVLADDGTRGFVFSNTMRIYDETTGAKPVMEAAAVLSAGIDRLFSRTWRPSWYQTMADEDRVDPEWFSLRFGLFADAVNRQVRLEMPGLSRVFQYTSITEDSGWFGFSGTPLKVRMEGSTSLYASWTGNQALAAAGAGESLPAGAGAAGAAPQAPGAAAAASGTAMDATWRADDPGARFIILDSDIGELVRRADGRDQEARRQFFSRIAGLRKGQGGAAPAPGTAPVPAASPAPGSVTLRPAPGGSLRIGSGGSYLWSETDALPAGFPPPATAGGESRGEIRFGLVLAPDLARAWEGSFALMPESGEARSIYLYRIGQDGVTLSRALQGPVGSPLGSADQRLGSHLMTLAGP